MGGGDPIAVLYYIVLYCTVQVPIQLLPGEGEECGGMQQPRTEPSMVEMFEELAQIAVIKVAKYLVDNNIKNIYFMTLYIGGRQQEVRLLHPDGGLRVRALLPVRRGEESYCAMSSTK